MISQTQSVASVSRSDRMRFFVCTPDAVSDSWKLCTGCSLDGENATGLRSPIFHVSLQKL